MAARLWSGEIAILISELERLSKLSIYSLAMPPDKPKTVLADALLGIQKTPYGELKRDGEYLEYSVSGGDSRRFSNSEMKGYRTAFSAITSEFQSFGALQKQLEKPESVAPSSETEIYTFKLGVWQVHSTL